MGDAFSVPFILSCSEVISAVRWQVAYQKSYKSPREDYKLVVGPSPHSYSGMVSFVSIGLPDSALDGVVFIRLYFYIVLVDVVTRGLAVLENGRI